MLLYPSWQLGTVEPLLSSQLPEMAVRSVAGVGAKRKELFTILFPNFRMVVKLIGEFVANSIVCSALHQYLKK